MGLEMIKLLTLLEVYDLEPKKLGIAGKKLKSGQLKKIVKSNLSGKLDSNMKSYITHILNSIGLLATYGDFKIDNTIFKNEVEKNFGEIIAALELSNGGLIEFPSSSTFPMIDFIIHDKDKIRQYSVKSAKAATNTLKVKDIIKIIDSDKSYHNLYKNSFPYYVMDILNQSSVKDAALNIADTLGLKYNKRKQDDGHERYKIEKQVVDYLNKEKNKFKRMINSVLTIDYVIVKIDKNFRPIIQTKNAKDIDIYFRTKNNAPTDHKPEGRWKDKIGFQVK
tara:strand:+ start:24 stop:860 length:837 start_codon:yes stop_codon:yes gene_type:complete